MAESIIRTVVFCLLSVSTSALATASVLLRLGQSSKDGNDQILTKNGVEDTDFYSSPIDLLCAQTAVEQKHRTESLPRSTAPIHLATRDGDLVDTRYELQGLSRDLREVLPKSNR